MKSSIEERFLLLKSLCNSFSTSARPFDVGFSSLVVDMGDGTVSKFYQPNRYGAERNKQQLLNEAEILKTFNGRIGNFVTPALTGEAVIFEDDHPLAADFIGFIPMTKLEGRTIEWDILRQSFTPHDFTIYHEEMGSLIASIHDSATGLHYSSRYTPTPFRINTPWLTDPEIIQMVDVCNQWFEQRQVPGFVHDDIGGKNIIIDKNNHIQGVLDFSFSGPCSNDVRDFSNIFGDYLPPAIAGYERTSGKKLDRTLIEMTQIQNLGAYISNLKNSGDREQEFQDRKKDFETWVRSITKDLALQ